jgi:hypothetical protein
MHTPNSEIAEIQLPKASRRQHARYSDPFTISFGLVGFFWSFDVQMAFVFKLSSRSLHCIKLN